MDMDTMLARWIVIIEPLATELTALQYQQQQQQQDKRPMQAKPRRDKMRWDEARKDWHSPLGEKQKTTRQHQVARRSRIRRTRAALWSGTAQEKEGERGAFIEAIARLTDTFFTHKWSKRPRGH